MKIKVLSLLFAIIMDHFIVFAFELAEIRQRQVSTKEQWV